MANYLPHSSSSGLLWFGGPLRVKHSGGLEGPWECAADPRSTHRGTQAGQRDTPAAAHRPERWGTRSSGSQQVIRRHRLTSFRRRHDARQVTQ